MQKTEKYLWAEQVQYRTFYYGWRSVMQAQEERIIKGVKVGWWFEIQMEQETNEGEYRIERRRITCTTSIQSIETPLQRNPLEREAKLRRFLCDVKGHISLGSPYQLKGLSLLFIQPTTPHIHHHLYGEWEEFNSLIIHFEKRGFVPPRCLGTADTLIPSKGKHLPSCWTQRTKS